MSREKQIEEMVADISERQNGGWKFVGDSEYTTDVYNEEIAETLYNAGYRKQEWISVEDRLPETYGSVICYTGYESVMELVYNPKYKLFNVSYDNIENAIAVTHWMPLPEAPKI